MLTVTIAQWTAVISSDVWGACLPLCPWIRQCIAAQFFVCENLLCQLDAFFVNSPTLGYVDCGI